MSRFARIIETCTPTLQCGPLRLGQHHLLQLHRSYHGHHGLPRPSARPQRHVALRVLLQRRGGRSDPKGLPGHDGGHVRGATGGPVHGDGAEHSAGGVMLPDVRLQRARWADERGPGPHRSAVLRWIEHDELPHDVDNCGAPARVRTFEFLLVVIFARSLPPSPVPLSPGPASPPKSFGVGTE